MHIPIARLDRIQAQFNSKLTESHDEQHLAFSSLPTDILLMAQKLVKVKTQLKAEVQLVGHELARIDDHGQLLHLEFQKVHESFATQVAKRPGETDELQARHKAVTSQLQQPEQGTNDQCMHRDLLLDQEIPRINEQHK